jgi:hypothetical protein
MAWYTYRCDADSCGAERYSTGRLAIYGTCRECGCGLLRRVMQLDPPADARAIPRGEGGEG